MVSETWSCCSTRFQPSSSQSRYFWLIPIKALHTTDSQLFLLVLTNVLYMHSIVRGEEFYLRENSIDLNIVKLSVLAVQVFTTGLASHFSKWYKKKSDAVHIQAHRDSPAWVVVRLWGETPQWKVKAGQKFCWSWLFFDTSSCAGSWSWAGCLGGQRRGGEATRVWGIATAAATWVLTQNFCFLSSDSGLFAGWITAISLSLRVISCAL